MKYYIMAFHKYADSDGRASRREIIWFFVINWLIGILFNFVGKLLDSEIFIALTGLYSFVIMCPWICLQIRRLHDVGKSGFWWWTVLVPFLNLYLIYLLFFKRGEACANRFGPPVRHDIPEEAPRRDMGIRPEEAPRQDEAFPVIPAPLPEGRPRFCRYCGTEFSEGARYCRMCGAVISE